MQMHANTPRNICEIMKLFHCNPLELCHQFLTLCDHPFLLWSGIDTLTAHTPPLIKGVKVAPLASGGIPYDFSLVCDDRRAGGQGRAALGAMGLKGHVWVREGRSGWFCTVCGRRAVHKTDAARKDVAGCAGAWEPLAERIRRGKRAITVVRQARAQAAGKSEHEMVHLGTGRFLCVKCRRSDTKRSRLNTIPCVLARRIAANYAHVWELLGDHHRCRVCGLQVVTRPDGKVSWEVSRLERQRWRPPCLPLPEGIPRYVWEGADRYAGSRVAFLVCVVCGVKARTSTVRSLDSRGCSGFWVGRSGGGKGERIKKRPASASDSGKSKRRRVG